ncbi:hypothetical protein B0H14DRAFT_3155947 [Mycena olivaceomarginata]|nr:hypothetical protein B0H14DRAFT_3155947 [Mycena olivaceomarginata]
MGDLAITYSDLGEHQKAKELEDIVLEKQKQVLRDNHPDTLCTMGNLDITYSDLGEHQKAKELEDIMLEKRKQVLGDNHPKGILLPHQPFILTLIARMLNIIVDKTESEVD